MAPLVKTGEKSSKTEINSLPNKRQKSIKKNVDIYIGI
jgi:hypothetical protein